jgi:hypothetical protein
LDPAERFGLDNSSPMSGGLEVDAAQFRIHNRYADRSNAILLAKQAWTELRRTTLSPEAIATALAPANATTHGDRSALG